MATHKIKKKKSGKGMHKMPGDKMMMKDSEMRKMIKKGMKYK